ncbi:MAG TPA: thiamine pyrophosphate-dependent enzyme [Pseudomonadales bacterium]|nr:thiamine pyrophosphate-dependent enzyme [Pseudomonadales bacterium]
MIAIELMRVGVMQAGPNANKVLNLGNPRLNFAEMARAMGVPAARVTSAAEFNDKFAEAMAQRGPRLIEVML